MANGSSCRCCCLLDFLLALDLDFLLAVDLEVPATGSRRPEAPSALLEARRFRALSTLIMTGRALPMTGRAMTKAAG